MKRLLCIALCIVLLPLLTGCESRQHRHKRIMESTKEYVLENQELIREAAQWLLSYYGDQEWPESGCTIHIERSAKDEISAKNYTTDEITVVENSACRTLLLDDGIFQYKFITLHIKEDRQTVEFCVWSIGGDYEVAYVPSGDLEDIWGYNERLTYEEKDGGLFCAQTGTDNEFFYLPICDDLIYCESYF